ncbi:UNVERIFIED_CONTAM: hypothetical protein PYX00_011614 [Menopon gallinae]|uniref:proteasome endopeptidase complex n=1 Tax=Menopon gallinae TaxID=328185 RepID=A0AAW2H860_9NEOP
MHAPAPPVLSSAQPAPKKTGTTIVGLRFAGGVALFADTRATIGDVVEDKNCFKLHRLADTIHCAGAGTAADTEHLTASCARFLTLFRRKYCRRPFVNTAQRFLCSHLHRYRGEIGAALILAGVDCTGAHLLYVMPHGSSAPMWYTSMGSGSLAATAVLDAGFRRDMDEHDAVALGMAAVEAGILNDLYSGSNIDYAVIDERGTRMFRNAKAVAGRVPGERIRYPRDSVRVSREDVFNFVEEVFE